MIFPSNIEFGDKVGIIATARKISIEELNPSIQLLKSWGLDVLLAPDLFEINNQFAGTDDQRASDLQWAIDHPELKLVITARGGYGSSRMIDLVDFSGLKKHPKWFLGFSDVTILLSELFNNQIASIHGPVALTLARENGKTNSQKLHQFLFKNNIESIECPSHKLNIAGKCEGALIGGNLTLLHTMLATKTDIDYSEKILFIEDLDEYLYHIDRMMVHLRRTGKLHQLAGIVVGQLSDMKDNTVPFGKTAEEIVFEHTLDLGIPVAFGFPIGHENDNYPVIIGGKYSFEVGTNGSILKFLKAGIMI